MSVKLSSDSVNPESHDRFRGLNGAFNKTLKALEICSEAGIFTTVATTVTALFMFMPEYPLAGNLKTESFGTIWNSTTFQALCDRTRLRGECEECRFRAVCGGCRAKAAAYEGDYLDSDPTCPIRDESQDAVFLSSRQSRTRARR